MSHLCVQASALQLEASGAPANHFSGMTNISPVQTGPDLDLPSRVEGPDLQRPRC